MLASFGRVDICPSLGAADNGAKASAQGASKARCPMHEQRGSRDREPRSTIRWARGGDGSFQVDDQGSATGPGDEKAATYSCHPSGKCELANGWVEVSR